MHEYKHRRATFTIIHPPTFKTRPHHQVNSRIHFFQCRRHHHQSLHHCFFSSSFLLLMNLLSPLFSPSIFPFLKKLIFDHHPSRRLCLPPLTRHLRKHTFAHTKCFPSKSQSNFLCLFVLNHDDMYGQRGVISMHECLPILFATANQHISFLGDHKRKREKNCHRHHHIFFQFVCVSHLTFSSALFFPSCLTN